MQRILNTLLAALLLVGVALPAAAGPFSGGERRERGSSERDQEEYEERRAELAEENVDDRIDLARWCERRRLTDEATALYEEVIALDPDHAFARRKLGFERKGDEWILREPRRRSGDDEENTAAPGTVWEGDPPPPPGEGEIWADWAENWGHAVAALDYLNALRAGTDLPPVAIDAEIMKGLYLHGQYMEVHGLGGHYETPGAERYTPEGDAAARSSVLGHYFEARDGPSGLAFLIASFYHRAPLFDPALERTAFIYHPTARGNFMGLNFKAGRGGSARGADLVRYPYPGQENVQTTFFMEAPSPLPREHNGPAGNPITLFFHGSNPPRSDQVEWSLTDADGNAVPCYYSAPDRPANPSKGHNYGAICLIPRAPLAARTRYTVRIIGGRLEEEWSFTTR